MTDGNKKEMLIKVAFALLLLAFLQKGVHGQCSTPPINQAVYEGTVDIFMTCNRQVDAVWQVTPTTDETDNINITICGDTVDPSLSKIYGANQTGLVIRKATTTPVTIPISTAGMYLLRNSSDVRRGAKLLVVHEGPSCTCNAINSTSLQMDCSVTYADSIFHPINANMTWTSNGDFYKWHTPKNTRVNDMFVSTSTIVVDANVPANYQCTLTFTKPTSNQFHYVATNAPEFAASCNLPFCNRAITTSPTSTTEPPTTSSPTSTTELPTTISPKSTNELPATSSPTSTNESTTTTLPTSTTELPTTISPKSTYELPATSSPTSTNESTTTTLPTSTTKQPTTTISSKITELASITECSCPSCPTCPPSDQNCARASEYWSDGADFNEIYDEYVMKAELYGKCDSCCQDALLCGVVVTLRNDNRWLMIHDPYCNDDRCEIAVLSASFMSSDWKLLAEKIVTKSVVGEYVKAGNIVSDDITTCSESCKRMMDLP